MQYDDRSYFGFPIIDETFLSEFTQRVNSKGGRKVDLQIATNQGGAKQKKEWKRWKVR